MCKSIDLVVQLLPPQPDAIGEYTACLAAELSQTCRPVVYTSRCQADLVPGTRIDECFSLQGPKRFLSLQQRLCSSRADAIVLQYNPFGWGQRGWAPDLISCFRTVKKAHKGRLAVMFHETYMMNPGWKAGVMRLYQKWQFRSLVRLADVSFFSTQRWAQQHAGLSRSGKVFHLPVGANVPLSDTNTNQTRAKLKIGLSDFVCGVFGGRHPSRMTDWIQLAYHRIRASLPSNQRCILLHVGGETIDWSLDPASILRTGRLSAKEAADAIATMDVLLNPLTDGISTRRGSAMAGIQQGVPLLSTDGHATDDIWRTETQGVFLAKPSSDSDWYSVVDRALAAILHDSNSVRESAKLFYMSNFDWPKIARRMIYSLSNES